MEKLVMKTSYYEGQYGCICEQLPGWDASYRGKFDEFDAYVRESINFYVDSAKKYGDDYPSLLDGAYELEYDLNAAALLAKLTETFTFAGLQTITGINQKQLAHYMSGRSTPRPQQLEKIRTGVRGYITSLRNFV